MHSNMQYVASKKECTGNNAHSIRGTASFIYLNFWSNLVAITQEHDLLLKEVLASPLMFSEASSPHET